MLISLLFMLGIFACIIGSLVLLVVARESAIAFLDRYAPVIIGIILGGFIGLYAYFKGWLKAIRIVFVNSIYGGSFFCGITTEDPFEINIRDVLGEELPDATITVVPTGKILSRGTVLLPISHSSSFSWGEFISGSGGSELIKIREIFGRVVSIEEFLASVYGLDIDPNNPKASNPNDYYQLKNLLRKVDWEKARRYIFVDPYERPTLIVEAMKECSNPAETSTALETLRKQKRFYGAIISRLLVTLQSLVREYSEAMETIGSYVLEHGKISLRNIAIPLKLQAEQLGVPAHRTWSTSAPMVMESPRGMREIAREVYENARAIASAMGYDLVPADLLEEVERIRKIQKQIMEKIQIEAPSSSEKKVEETVKKLEGK